MWRKVIPALAKEHRVYAPDLRGFGWSDAPAGPYEKGAWPPTSCGCWTRSRSTAASLAGHDWGGFVAWLRRPAGAASASSGSSR